MDAVDRKLILDILAQGRDALLNSVAGVSESQAKVRPAAGGWSIEECVEHVALAEDGMYQGLTRKLVPSSVPADPAREMVIQRGIADRSRKFEAPEWVRPTGRFGSLAAALERFHENRARTVEHVNTCMENLRSKSGRHPIVGPVTGMELLLIMAQHPVRHAEQIREIRKTLGLTGESS